MVKTLKLCCDQLGYIKVNKIVIFSDSNALLLYSYVDRDGIDALSWQYFNPENGEMIDPK